MGKQRLDHVSRGGRYQVGDRVVNANGQALGGGPEAQAAPAQEPEASLEREELRKVSLDDLRGLAIDAGADAEAVQKMRSKDQVIDALEAEIDLAEIVKTAED